MICNYTCYVASSDTERGVTANLRAARGMRREVRIASPAAEKEDTSMKPAAVRVAPTRLLPALDGVRAISSLWVSPSTGGGPIPVSNALRPTTPVPCI